MGYSAQLSCFPLQNVQEATCCTRNRRSGFRNYVPFGEEIDHQEDAAEVSFTDQELEEGFYEVEEVLGRRLRKDVTYEFEVRFKGY